MFLGLGIIAFVYCAFEFCAFLFRLLARPVGRARFMSIVLALFLCMFMDLVVICVCFVVVSLFVGLYVLGHVSSWFLLFVVFWCFGMFCLFF